MPRLLTDLVYTVASIAYLPLALRRKRGGLRERLGRVEPIPAPPSGRPRVMLHAVSVGEVNLVRSLVARLAEEADVLLTVTTDTGIARARELYAGVAHVRRYPLDFSRCVRRFLNEASPDAVALVELELWPQFVTECRRRGIPVSIINGRLSERSFKRYHAARVLVGPFFRRVRWVGAQDGAYAERFGAMGCADVEVIDTMKWDAAPSGDAVGADQLAKDLGIDRTKPLVVAGSTAPGEHELLRDALPEGVQLLCAPRRPEWWDGAASVFPGCVRRSQPDAGDPSAGRFILDTIGELRDAYALADVVVVGRSFVDLHGSDPMEPAAMGKPVIIGPNVSDFQSVVETMERDGAIIRADRETIADELRRLLENEGERHAQAQRASACVEKHRGASARYAEKLLDIVAQASSA